MKRRHSAVHRPSRRCDTVAPLVQSAQTPAASVPSSQQHQYGEIVHGRPVDVQVDVFLNEIGSSRRSDELVIASELMMTGDE